MQSASNFESRINHHTIELEENLVYLNNMIQMAKIQDNIGYLNKKMKYHVNIMRKHCKV